jgi:hypothetical protein
MPEHRDPQRIGVECQVQFLRVAHTDRARPGAFNEIAIHDRFVERHQFYLARHEPHGLQRLVAIAEIPPDGSDLPVHRTVEHRGQSRWPSGNGVASVPGPAG